MQETALRQLSAQKRDLVLTSLVVALEVVLNSLFQQSEYLERLHQLVSRNKTVDLLAVIP
jgi:hypothetical protein